MARRVGHDELALLGLEVAVRDVDRDALFTLGGEAVQEQREVERPSLRSDPTRFGFERLLLIIEQQSGLVEQSADHGALAVVDAAAGDEAQQAALALGLHVGGELLTPRLGEGHQK